MSSHHAEIQELRHRIALKDRQRKALRAEALALSAIGRKKLADDRRTRAKKLDLEILRAKQRLDTLRKTIKLPTIKLPFSKKATAAKKSDGKGGSSRTSGKGGTKRVFKTTPSALRAAAEQQSAARFQPSDASAPSSVSQSTFPPPAQAPTYPADTGFQPSQESYYPAATTPGAQDPNAPATSAEADASTPFYTSPIFLVTTAVVATGAGYYYWRKRKKGGAASPVRLSGVSRAPSPTISDSKPEILAPKFASHGFTSLPR